MEETPSLVSVEELDWTAVTEEQIKQIEADVIIAAGRTYYILSWCEGAMKQIRRKRIYFFVLADAYFTPLNESDSDYKSPVKAWISRKIS